MRRVINGYMVLTVRMVRKTNSVGADTWDALSALGKFGQSFDDIIKILLVEHEELKEMKGLHPQRQRESPSAQQQLPAVEKTTPLGDSGALPVLSPTVK